MGKVRVSVANLADQMVKRVHLSESHPESFGILNPKKLEQGVRSFQALGGGAMLTPEGKSMLEREYDATDFEFDETTGFYDARFQIDEEHLNTVLAAFSAVGANGAAWFEKDPTLDIKMELSGKEFPGYHTILTPEEVQQVQVRFREVKRQKLPAVGADTSGRAKADMPTHRLFRKFDLVMSPESYIRCVSSPVLKLLSAEELATTDGGSKAGRTRDGEVLQNNLIL
jgi:hypothetical protein